MGLMRSLDANFDARFALIWRSFVCVASGLFFSASFLFWILPKDSLIKLSDEIKGQFIYPSTVRPEPTERTIFIVLLVLIPIFSYLVLEIMKRVTPGWKSGLAGCIALLFANLAFIFCPIRFFSNTFGEVWSDPWLRLIFFIIALVGSWALLGKQSAFFTKKKWARSLAWLFVAVMTLGLVPFRRVFSIEQVSDTIAWNQHIDALLYSISQAAVGRIPLQDFPALYGLYGKLLVPWFHLVGLSVFSFSLTMTLLYGVATVCVLLTCFTRIRNLLVQILCAVSLLYFTWNWYLISGNADAYLQYFPLRYLCPAICLAMLSLYRDRTNGWFALIGGGFAAWSMLWNVDSGLAVLATWIAMYLYFGLCAYLERETKAFRAYANSLVLFSVTFFAVVALFFAYLSWQSGSLLEPLMLFKYQKLYVSSGFQMMPMPLRPDVGYLVFGTYVLGALLTVSRWLKITKNTRVDFLTLLTVMGLVLYVYYQGRSLDPVLAEVMWPAVVIWFCLVDWVVDLYLAGRVNKYVAMGFCTPILFVGMLSLSKVVIAIPDVFSFRGQQSEKSSFRDDLAFIRGELGSDKEVEILAIHQAVFYAELGLPSALHGPGLMETILTRDAREIESQLLLRPPKNLVLGHPFNSNRPAAFNETNFLEDSLARILKAYSPPVWNKTHTLAYYRKLGENQH